MTHRFLRCLSTVSMGGTLTGKLEATRHAGFEAVELFERDVIDSGETPASVRRAAGDLGLPIEVYGPLYDMEGVAGDAYPLRRARGERLLDVAAEIGARTILVCSNTSASAIDDAERSAAQLSAFADEAAARGLQVGFEALSWGTHIRTYGAAWDVVRRAAHRSLGLVVDTFHTSALSDDPSAIGGIPGDGILLVQIADAPPLERDLVFHSRHHRCLPGEGVFDLEAILRHLGTAGYRGPMCLEIFSDRLRQACPLDSARRAMESFRRLERTMSCEVGSAHAAALS